MAPQDGHSSIPAAIDYLLGIAQQATDTIDADVTVTDGWPDTLAEFMFTVAADRPPAETEGEQATATLAWQGLGAKTVQETYGVPCYIFASTGGVTQKECRDQVFALWDAFYVLLRDDLSLGGALDINAAVTDFRLEGPKSTVEAEEGRYALLLFTITCTNRY